MSPEQFDDPYAVRIGIPTLSWKYARPKDGISGIILPRDGKAYLLGQQTDIKTGELLWWPPGADGARRPRVQQDFLLGNVADVRSGKKVGPEEWLSGKATERFTTASQSGDPEAMALIARVNEFYLRRQIIKGESLEKGMKAAVAALASELGPRPVIGAYLSITLAKLEANAHGGETKIYDLKYKAPDDASREFVALYLAALPGEGADPYEGKADFEPASADSEDEEPPF